MSGKTFYAAGLDAGSERIRLVVCVLEDGRLRLVGRGEAPSAGWVKSRIADQAAVTGSILTALREAEAAAGVSLESVVVGMGGQTGRGANCRGVLELGHPREITQQDVNRVTDRARRVQLQEDRMVLQLFPQDFVVDHHPGHRDPRRMVASQLEVNVHLITCSVQEHSCLLGAVHQAHLSVEETVFEPLAACYAAVLPEDRREGIAVVDIGAQSTGLVVYYGDSLQLASTLPLCGDHFTRDVASGLRIGYEEALLLKLQYGSAVSAYTAENSLVEVSGAGSRDHREAPRRLLNRILEARAQELFEYVYRELARVGMERALIGGVVLTGGGANLADLCDVAERELNCPARKGLAIGMRNWPEESDDPAWTTAAGLAMYSARLKVHGERERQAAGLLGRILK
ncbi:MAG TPA: cell division protein FtsA [Bryobacteraceae bacterium]|nr:cell division protein FtsA [Bryobacteraceae bacterium]